MHNTIPIHKYNTNECACRLHLMKQKKNSAHTRKRKKKKKMLTIKPVFRIAVSLYSCCVCGSYRWSLEFVHTSTKEYPHTKKKQHNTTWKRTSQIFTPLDDFWFEQIYRNKSIGVKIFKIFGILPRFFFCSLCTRHTNTCTHPVLKLIFGEMFCLCVTHSKSNKIKQIIWMKPTFSGHLEQQREKKKANKTDILVSPVATDTGPISMEMR